MSKPLIAPHRAPQIYQNQFAQLADDAAFLWLLHSIAVNQPHYTQTDLVQLESRVDAQLDGLMTAPEESWELCFNAFQQHQQAGEAFAASILAFRSLEINKIQAVVVAGLASDETFKGLVAALAWLPGKFVHSWIKKFLTSKDINHKYLALAVCSARREDPKEYITNILQREDCLSHEKLYVCALQIAGQLKRFDLMPAVRVAMQSDNKNIVFWAHWSAILMGDKNAALALQSVVVQKNPHQLSAIQISMRSLPIDVARNWIGLLAKNPANIRVVIAATGILGDPQAINWLIEQARVPLLTRLAGEALTLITGIDLEANKLALEALPNLDDQLPNDDAAEHDIEMNEDDRLPFPDVDKIAAIWQKYSNRFIAGQRYFMGQQINTEHLHNIYKTGYQRQRSAAAVELALLDAHQFLFNHAAKGIGE